MSSAAREVTGAWEAIRVPCSESTALVTVHFTPGFLGLDIHPTTAAILAVARESQAGRASVVRPIPPSAALASTLSFTLALDWQDAGRDGGMGKKWVVGLTGSRMGRCKAQFRTGCTRERAPGSLPGSLAYRARSRVAFGSNCFLRQSASGPSVYAHVVLCIRTAWRGPGAHVGVA
jgi:hypothetical protein